MIATIAEQLVKIDNDPITDIFDHDWAAVGGWSLFIGLTLLMVFGVFKGWVVPGWMYRDQAKVLDEAMKQNSKLLSAADITKHFFETTAKKPTTPRKPRREREVTHDLETKAEETEGTLI